MRAEPIPAVLPLGEAISDVRFFWIYRAPELLEIGALGTFNLAIEVRRTRPDRTELDAPIDQLLLDLLREELEPAISLNSLNGERHFLDDLLEKDQRVSGGAARKNAQHLVA